MELLFLLILVLLMVTALTSGFPVAFSLPGSAILAIALAALCGWLFAGDPDAYFAHGGPTQWLSAGVTNFRSLYWDVERDTLIAIPLFIFMGIMLQRSKIAEDLLVAMAQLFGPVPGGLGISVVLVGALLAATTGIVGATVIAMGLISLPAMLRNNYSKSLATGTICASGTLGQIIPPSIVLIILADQLSSAADQASTARKAEYKAATGEFAMPSTFDITSASAGDMFMGALIPGLVLVGLYVLYILVSALIKPESAPPVPYDGKYDRYFVKNILLALVPPLTLIFVVLGSIILGIATVNQAGAIGAVGAMIMGGYRLTAGTRNSYYPAILAIGSTVAIMVILGQYDLNIKSIKTDEDAFGIMLAGIAVSGLMIAVTWSAWRAYKIENTLNEVMLETAKTTSMVFIILVGAAMLTSAFRGFGGEELVKEFLTGLPGGFWTQFIVVMAVIFLLGFFLDFIEIAVVVVPIVAPILLADPGANVTAVWLGVMIGLNIQTSFLTPPFGFALFYLRGVAPKIVKTLHIYKGAVVFIGLQLLALAITGFFPSLVNYLPNRTYLTSETAPPPMNPRLQSCLEDYVFERYVTDREQINSAITRFQGLDISYLPKKQQKALKASQDKVAETFDRVSDIETAEQALLAYGPEYRPLHQQVRGIQRDVRKLDEQIRLVDRDRSRATREDIVDDALVAQLQQRVDQLKQQKAQLEAQIPDAWEQARKQYVELSKAEKKARGIYRSHVDGVYESVVKVRDMAAGAEDLAALESELVQLESVITTLPGKEALEKVKAVSKRFSSVKATSGIKSKLSKAAKALKKDKTEKALKALADAKKVFASEVEWRRRALRELEPELAVLNEAIKHSIGLRMQERLTIDQAEQIAACQSVHRDISLNF
ncbi:MAG: TRAP transporter large permease subunit [Motiliproteus sp.]|nr:TRAP transporter large permease subunit [Motiliproteus sp.]MCW9052259.1 TRAP transporter large permease subunit [Motiliproteus sp.]